MKELDVLKVLANQARLDILHWLKDPRQYFTHKSNHKPEVDMEIYGVCLEEIQRVSGLSQSTTSAYLSAMKRVGLVTATRMGKYTYFKRNDTALKDLSRFLDREL